MNGIPRETLGSAFAAIKAGILGGIFYAGVTGGFNLFVLYIFKNTALNVLSQLQVCSAITAGGSVSTPNECFFTFILVFLPYSVFIVFLVSLVFSCLFGILFERLPGESYVTRASVMTFVMLIVLLYFGFEGISFDSQQRILIAIFDFIMAYLFATILGSRYKRYTRAIEFTSQDPTQLRVIVGRRDVTGKIRTMAANSSHRLRASPLGNVVFKEWNYSGGVALEDPKSFETVMRVGGDGVVKASFTLLKG